jgi:2-keto-4-pentenoate hydratase/2-oxohepta-3-ene-1,7-dioic acid hydratase in catechol pathway
VALADRLRIVVYGPGSRVGAWVADQVIDLERASGGGLPADLGRFIETGARGIDAARAAVGRALDAAGDGLADGTVVRREAVQLRPPAVHRPRIACAAGNYAKHTLGSAARKGASESRALAGLVEPATDAALPTAEELTARTRERGRPRGFWKDFALPKGPGDDIPYPARAELFDYEGEVAVVIGRAARDVAPGSGGGLVWGVTLLNDWSIRGSSQKDSLSFNLSKNFDGGASLGPCIVVGGLDPSDLLVRTHVNGELRQDYHSGDMIFSHAEYIEYLSRDFTFLPGDVVSGGSGSGSATDASKGDPPDTSLFLKVGDVVEVSSESIGVLRNRIVRP